MTCSKKTQTQRDGTLVVHTCSVESHGGAGFRHIGSDTHVFLFVKRLSV